MRGGVKRQATVTLIVTDFDFSQKSHFHFLSKLKLPVCPVLRFVCVKIPRFQIRLLVVAVNLKFIYDISTYFFFAKHKDGKD